MRLRQVQERHSGKFGKRTRVSVEDSTAGPVAARQPTPGKTTRTEALSAAEPSPVQRKATGASAEGAVDATPAAASEAEEDFKPATGTKRPTHRHVRRVLGQARPDQGAEGDLGEYAAHIEMMPNKKTGDSKIAFVQVVRSPNEPGSAWHTKKDDPGMTAERAKRTDAKEGQLLIIRPSRPPPQFQQATGHRPVDREELHSSKPRTRRRASRRPKSTCDVVKTSELATKVGFTDW